MGIIAVFYIRQMFKYLTFVFILVAIGSSYAGRLKIIFAGDLMGHDSQISAAKTAQGYDYRPVYQYMEPYFKSADIAVINLEHTLAGEPYTGYPQFSSPDESVFAAKDAGFNLFATSNNHSLDRGKKGLERTLDVLDSMGLKRLGTYRDTAEWKRDYPLFMEKNGIKIAFLNYTYGTNGIAEAVPNVINRINNAQIAADIEKAKLSNPDFIIAFLHWGNEYENKESAEQRKLAGFLAESGVDLIIGGHPHVVQPFSKISVPGRDSVPVIYSLGNFFSNQRKRHTSGGVIFEAILEKTEDKTSVVSQSYLPFWVYSFKGKNGRTAFRLLPECETAPGCQNYNMSNEHKAAMDLFFEDTRKILENLPKISSF
jgi:poly-gamma-glutamate synthesis protein (capsule biosynthesis protein)